MIVAEVRAGDVPMEVLRFDIQAENVREEFPQRAGDLGYGFAAQIDRALRGFHCCALSHGYTRPWLRLEYVGRN
jgi:hypothetical protein